MEELPYKSEVTGKRLRKVIDDLIRIAVKLVFHARQQVLKLWDHAPWLGCFRKLYSICSTLWKAPTHIRRFALDRCVRLVGRWALNVLELRCSRRD